MPMVKAELSLKSKFGPPKLRECTLQVLKEGQIQHSSVSYDRERQQLKLRAVVVNSPRS